MIIIYATIYAIFGLIMGIYLIFGHYEEIRRVYLWQIILVLLFATIWPIVFILSSILMLSNITIWRVK